jgi:drug/metabolite transporter (DMT)-like permease
MEYAVRRTDSSEGAEHRDSIALEPDLRRRNVEGVAAVALATVIWGVTGTLVKVTSMPGTTITFWRVVFGIPVLGVAAAAQKQLSIKGPVASSLAAGLLFGSSIVLYFVALRHTTIANVTLIGALTPVAVSLFSYRVLGERVGFIRGFGIAAATAGVFLSVVAASGRPGWSGLGDLAAFVSLGFFVAYFIASKRIRRSMPNTRYNLLMTVGALAPATAAVLATRAPLLGFPIRDYAMVAAIALFPGSLGHWLVNWAHTRIRAATSATIQLGVPVVAILLGWAVVGETLSLLGLLGCAIALASIFVLIRVEARQEGAERLAEETEAIA